MKVSDLPQDVRRQLLNLLRAHFGDSTVDRAIDALGEEAVLDAVLQALSGELGLDRDSSLFSSGPYGPFRPFDSSPPLRRRSSPDHSGIVTGVLVMLGLGLAGVVCRFVLPWIWHGVTGWFEWLAGKF